MASRTYSGVVIPKTDTRKIRDNLNRRIEDVYQLLFRQLTYIGEAAVKKAREDGTYNDITGNLRSSIGYCILDDGNPIVNGKTERFEGKTGKGNEGAAASKALLKKLRSKFPQGVVLIVCAGMNYAAYVEDVRHRVVLSSAQLEAERLAKKLLNKLTEKV